MKPRAQTAPALGGHLDISHIRRANQDLLATMTHGSKMSDKNVAYRAQRLLIKEKEKPKEAKENFLGMTDIEEMARDFLQKQNQQDALGQGIRKSIPYVVVSSRMQLQKSLKDLIASRRSLNKLNESRASLKDVSKSNKSIGEEDPGEREEILNVPLPSYPRQKVFGGILKMPSESGMNISNLVGDAPNRSVMFSTDGRIHDEEKGEEFSFKLNTDPCSNESFDGPAPSPLAAKHKFQAPLSAINVMDTPTPAAVISETSDYFQFSSNIGEEENDSAEESGTADKRDRTASPLQSSISLKDNELDEEDEFSDSIQQSQSLDIIESRFSSEALQPRRLPVVPKPYAFPGLTRFRKATKAIILAIREKNSDTTPKNIFEIIVAVKKKKSTANQQQTPNASPNNKKKAGLSGRQVSYAKFTNFLRTNSQLLSATAAEKYISVAAAKPAGNDLVDGHLPVHKFTSQSLIALEDTNSDDGSDDSHSASGSNVRSERDTSILLHYLAPLPSVAKFTPQARRELCRRGFLEIHPKNRIMIRQGTRPIFVYFIVKGRFECVQAPEEDAFTKTFKASKETRWEGDNLRRKMMRNGGLGINGWSRFELGPGHCVGNVEIEKDCLRKMTVRCREETIVLRVDREDYERVLEIAREEDLRAKTSFLCGVILFAGIYERFEVRQFAECCETRQYAANKVILQEGIDLDELFILRKGECRIIKSVDFVKRTTPSGKIQLSPLTTEMEKSKVSGEIVTKLAVLGKVVAGDYFGEYGILSAAKKQALFDIVSHSQWKRHVNVISNGNVEVLVIRKVDFIRLANDKTYEVMLTELQDRMVPMCQIMTSFLENRSWQLHKEHVVEDIVERKRLTRSAK